MYFPARGETKLDLARYYLSVGDGIVRAPARFAELGDLHQGIDDSAYPLDTLLEWAERDGLD